MGTTLATYYAKLQDMPDSEYKVEILEDGPIKKIAVNGKIYEGALTRMLQFIILPECFMRGKILSSSQEGL